MNRMANSTNRYQGDYPRVLTVCSAGLLRAPTIAWVLEQEPFNCNARAAGVSNDYGLIVVDDVLIEWADLIICAETWHKESILKNFDVGNKPMLALYVPDVFPYRDPKLIQAVIDKLAENDITDKATLWARC
jgi:predicted protein tyrosine phosphatase